MAHQEVEHGRPSMPLTSAMKRAGARQVSKTVRWDLTELKDTVRQGVSRQERRRQRKCWTGFQTGWEDNPGECEKYKTLNEFYEEREDDYLLEVSRLSYGESFEGGY